jgi:hypothetical protein
VLHRGGKPEYKQQPKFNLTTGEMTVDTPTDLPASSVAVFMMILEHFRHIVVTRDHLSETELHSLLSWTQLQLANNKKLMIVERSVKEILKRMDDDHSLDLSRLISSDARSILDDQTDIDSSSFQRTAPTDKEKAAAKSAAAKTQPDDRPPLALKIPNGSCCWHETNGLSCANKNKVNGVCKYAHLHGNCGMPLGNGNFCMEKHKAAEHK